MSRGDPSDRIEGELARLQGLPLEELRVDWVRRFSVPAPQLRTRDLLVRAFAYRLQSRAFGAPTSGVRRQLNKLADGFDADPRFDPKPAPRPQTGTRILKEYGGERHEVTVTDNGYTYRGVQFRSLSAVARTITGTRWNGHVFFGLKSPGGAKPERAT